MPYVPVTRTPARKGFGYGFEGVRADRQRAALNLNWHYGWSPDYPGNPKGFVPMIWGAGSVEKGLAIIRNEMPKTQATHLLGFNEPDLAGQANMTVAEAVDLWPRLESAGLRLGSPATVKPSSTWLTEFMTEVDNNNLRVDFMPVHIYGWPDADDFLRKLEDLHAIYNKPIWVTEYAVADFTANTKEENRYSIAQVERFMTKTIAGMRKMPYVERFAWKTRDVNDPQMWSSALFQDDGTLTSRGRLYASY
jgi:hypothetical protein